MVKKGYKQTEVGVIPEDWEVVELESIADVKGGKRLPKGSYLEAAPTNQPYIRVTDMNIAGLSTQEILFVPDHCQKAIENYRIFKEDIYISVAGTLGLIGIIPDHLDGANLTENADRLTNIKCDQYYLMYLLRSDYIQTDISDKQTVGAQPKLAIREIQAFQLLLPPTLTEQRAIATALSDTDALLAAQDALIAKKEAFKRGMMEELLSGERRLEGFSGEWEEVRAGNIGEVFSGSSLTTDFGFGFPIYGSTGMIGKSPNFDYYGDAILIARVGANAGNVYSISGNYSVSDNTLIYKLDRNNSFKFIVHLFASFDLNKLVYGSGQPLVTGTIIKSLQLSLPPHPEQIAIATVLSDLDAELSGLRLRRDKLLRLKAGMMEVLLSGGVRLV